MIPAVEFTVDAVVAGLDRHGAVICRGVLDADRVASMHADLDGILSQTPTGRNDFEGFGTQRVYALFAKTRWFDDLAIHPVMGGVVEAVIGLAQLSAPVAIHIGPGEKDQVLHRDDSIYPLPEPHAEVVLNTMWAFDDFTAANGATRFIPDSHRWPPGRRPEASDPVVQPRCRRAAWRSTPARCGTAVAPTGRRHPGWA